jgi:hypothetical protein
MAVVPFHGHCHRKLEFLSVPFYPGEELREALLGVRDGELLEDPSLGIGDPHVVGVSADIYRYPDVGSHRCTSWWGIFIQAITSTAQGHCPDGPASFRWTSLDEERGGGGNSKSSSPCC